MRKGLLNCRLESDLDANFFEIINLKSSGSIQGGITYVDSMAPDDTSGQPGAAAPFKTLGSALAVTPSGYNIVMRPGAYSWDGFITVAQSVKIFAYGAIVSPATTNHAGLLVSAPDVQIHGMQFDGGFVSGLSDDDSDGCIAIFNGGNCVLRDLIIEDQHNTGIELRDRFDGVKIDACTISGCFKAVVSAAPSTNLAEVIIIRNRIFNNREGAIKITGTDNVNILRVVLISDNLLIGNDTAAQHSAAIEFDAGGQDISILSNQIVDTYDGINLTKTQRAILDDNTIVGCRNNIINVFGHKTIRINGNILDGSHAVTGAITSLNGVVLSGDYDAANDSSHAIITDNTIRNIQTNGFPISVANANKIKISANYFDGTAGTVKAAAFTFLTISDNSWNIGSNDPPIILDAAERGWNNAAITGNRFNVSSPTRLIGTADLLGNGQQDLQIIANSSTAGKTYSGGTVGAINGTAPTNVKIKGNSPVATGNPTTGWVNDDDPVQQNTVFVSQLRGNNASATRESKGHAYLTINAAITAATSGDMVYVQDGVFDELIVAKDGITVRFMPEATLACVTASGCLTTNVDGETFHLYHEHTWISSAKAGGQCLAIADAGIYHIHADMVNTGTNTGTIAHALSITDSANVNVYGSIFSTNGNGISCTGGTPSILVAPVKGRSSTIVGTTHIWSTNALAISLQTGIIDAVDVDLINGGGASGISLKTDVVNYRFTRCKIKATATAAPAVAIVATASTTVPTFIDCILQSESTATGSMTTTGAQTVRIMGSVMANKGADPPTNITFTGGGEYTVNAGVTVDL